MSARLLFDAHSSFTFLGPDCEWTSLADAAISWRKKETAERKKRASRSLGKCCFLPLPVWVVLPSPLLHLLSLLWRCCCGWCCFPLLLWFGFFGLVLHSSLGRRCFVRFLLGGAASLLSCLGWCCFLFKEAAPPKGGGGEKHELQRRIRKQHRQKGGETTFFYTLLLKNTFVLPFFTFVLLHRFTFSPVSLNKLFRFVHLFLPFYFLHYSFFLFYLSVFFHGIVILCFFQAFYCLKPHV